MKSAASRAIRALPTMLRIGVAETVVYRAQFFVATLTSTMPLIMLALWTSVAADGSFHQYSSADFVAYYLATLILRQLTSLWVVWQISDEIRMGILAMRLLRPMHPFIAYLATHIAAIPFRLVIALPVAIALLVASSASVLPTEPLQLALIVPSIALAWLITFGIMLATGSLSFWITQTMSIWNLYVGLYMVLSGYLLPLDLLKPHFIAVIASAAPFRFMLSAPVEMMTKRLDSHHIVMLLAGQLVWAVVAVVGALWIWRAGIRRFEAVGT